MDPAAVSYAVIARLKTIEPSRITHLDGEVKTTPAGAYSVFYDMTPGLTSRRHSGQSTHLRWMGMIVCAGRDAGEARWCASKVLLGLTNYRITTDRDTSWILPSPDSAPVLPDRSVPGDIRFSQTLTFTCHTNLTRSNP